MIILGFFIATVLLWLFFIATANLVHAGKQNKYTGIKKYFTYVWVGFFILSDILFDVTYGTIVFMELPHYERLTLTARLRHIIQTRSKDSWRWKLAVFFCYHLIEPWDYNHCGLAKYIRN